MLQDFVILWTCCNHEKKQYFVIQLSEHVGIYLTCHKNMLITFSHEHCEASNCNDANIRLAPLWFKDLEGVFNRIQGAHIHNTILIDDMPHKNLFNDPYNSIHSHVFGEDLKSSPHDSLMVTKWRAWGIWSRDAPKRITCSCPPIISSQITNMVVGYWLVSKEVVPPPLAEEAPSSTNAES